MEYLLDPDVDYQEQFIILFTHLPKKNSSTIVRVFSLWDDYYYFEGKDAEMVAEKYLPNAKEPIQTWKTDSSSVSMCKVKKDLLNTILLDLLMVVQIHVEVWTLDPGKGELYLDKSGSPGNLTKFDNVLYNNDKLAGFIAQSSLLSIQIVLDDGISMLACAHLDMSARTILVCKIALTDFETLLIQLAPSECIVPKSVLTSGYHDYLVECLAKSSVLVTERMDSEFDPKQSRTERRNLIKTGLDNSQKMPEGAVGCINAIVEYLRLANDNDFSEMFHIKSHNLNDYLKFDCDTFKRLNLLSHHSEDASSLFFMLNKCRTAHGQRMLTKWIRQPLLDVDEIIERQDIVDALASDSELRESLVKNLEHMHDFHAIEWRYIKYKLMMQDCYTIYMAAKALSNMIVAMTEYFGKYASVIQEKFVKPFESLAKDLYKFRHTAAASLDFIEVVQNLDLIDSSFRPDLTKIKEKLVDIKESVESLAKEVARDLNLESVKIKYNMIYNYTFWVPRKNSRTGKIISGFIMLQNEQLDLINEQCEAVATEYRDTIMSKLIAFEKRASYDFLDSLRAISSLAAQLDVLVSFATIVALPPDQYARPKMRPVGSGIMVIKFTEENKNKSINSMSSVSDILFVMAQIGCFMPAISADMTVINFILTPVESKHHNGSNDSNDNQNHIMTLGDTSQVAEISHSTTDEVLEKADVLSSSKLTTPDTKASRNTSLSNEAQTPKVGRDENSRTSSYSNDANGNRSINTSNSSCNSQNDNNISLV